MTEKLTHKQLLLRKMQEVASFCGFTIEDYAFHDEYMSIDGILVLEGHQITFRTILDSYTIIELSHDEFGYLDEKCIEGPNIYACVALALDVIHERIPVE